MKKILIPAVAMLATACANPAYTRLAADADARAANLQITCRDKVDCPTKWARAMQWVSENSAYKLRMANDSIITTEGPLDEVGYSFRSAMEVNRIPLGNGTTQIIFKSSCVSYSCVPTHNILLVQFADFVNATPVQH